MEAVICKETLLEMGVKGCTIGTYTKMAQQVMKGHNIMLGHISDEAGLSYRSIKRHIKHLVDMKVLCRAKGGRGHCSKFWLNDPTKDLLLEGGKDVCAKNGLEGTFNEKIAFEWLALLKVCVDNFSDQQLYLVLLLGLYIFNINNNKSNTSKSRNSIRRSKSSNKHKKKNYAAKKTTCQEQKSKKSKKKQIATSKTPSSIITYSQSSYYNNNYKTNTESNLKISGENIIFYSAKMLNSNKELFMKAENIENKSHGETKKTKEGKCISFASLPLTERKNTLLDHLFKRFSSMFGGSWDYQFKSPDKCTKMSSSWKEVFDQLEEDQIVKAAKSILGAKTKFVDFPPTPLQFKHLCVSMSSTSKEWKRRELDETITSPDVALIKLKEIKSLLAEKMVIK